MERVETLLKKINDLFAEGASAEQLLLATQMLQAELHHLQNLTNTSSFGNISISILPNNNDFTVKKEELLVTIEPEKTIEILQVDEAEIEAELEEIKRNAETFQQISVKNKPQLIFEEDTPLHLITNILPDVLVKGGDYTLEQIVGAKEVIANGGEVKIAPIVEGFSTTRIIEKMRK